MPTETSPPVAGAPPTAGGTVVPSTVAGAAARLTAVLRFLRTAAPTDAATAAGLAALTLGIYLRSLLPGIGYSGDVAKWQFLGAVGGTPHPTGYPLYLALNRAFVHLVPMGSLAWRANLLSAVLGAATVAGLHLLLRTLGVRPAVAAATAATFAVSFTFWSQAVVAEVYTLHLLLLVAFTTCLVRWRAGGSDGWLRAGLALCALSFGNHLGTALALPGVAWIVWTDRRRALTAANVAWAAGAAVLGAAQYGYLVWMTRVGVYVETPVDGLGDVVATVTGGRFRDQMMAFGPGELVRDRLPLFGRLLHKELDVLVAPAVYGMIRALRAPGPHRPLAVHLALLGTLAAIYALGFDVPDVFVFFLPTWLALAVFLGVGLDSLADSLHGVGERMGGRRQRWVAGAGALALAATPVVMALVNYPRASQRGTTADAERIERAIDAAGRDALFVTDGYADSEYLWYHVLGEGLGEERDLEVAHDAPTPDVVRFVRGGAGPLARLAEPGTPVYTPAASQAAELADAGLRVVPAARDVWRVEAP